MSLFPLPIIWIILAGLMSGLFVATSGAIKDIRWESFSYKKFLRTPIFSMIWVFVLSSAFVFNEWIILMLSATAMERITTECWKLIRRKAPGKFADPDKDHKWYLKGAQNAKSD